jgi:hypothetical protein
MCMAMSGAKRSLAGPRTNNGHIIESRVGEQRRRVLRVSDKLSVVVWNNSGRDTVCAVEIEIIS